MYTKGVLIMEQTSLQNFLNNVEYAINNVIDNNEPTAVRTEEGNVILMTEEEYRSLVLNSNITT